MTARKRLQKDQGDREAVLDAFGEMEASAAKRIKASGRMSSLPGMKLKIPNQDPDFHYFWATDLMGSSGYHGDMLERGYKYVRHEVGEYAGEVLQNKHKSTTLYAMRIPLTDYEDILNEHRNRVNRTELGLRNLEENQYAADESGKGVTQAQETKSEFNPLMD